MRDSIGQTRGVGFVTFYSLEAATHTYKAAQGSVIIDKVKCRCAYSQGFAAAEVLLAATERDSRGRRDRDYASTSRRRPRDREQGEERSRSRSRSRSQNRGSGANRAPRYNEGSKAPTKRTEWPPPFNVDGAAYTFDTASGYFFEPASGFYYDPKNKIYYDARHPGARDPSRDVRQRQSRRVVTDLPQELKLSVRAYGRCS